MSLTSEICGKFDSLDERPGFGRVSDQGGKVCSWCSSRVPFQLVRSKSDCTLGKIIRTTGARDGQAESQTHNQLDLIYGSQDLSPFRGIDSVSEIPKLNGRTKRNLRWLVSPSVEHIVRSREASNVHGESRAPLLRASASTVLLASLYLDETGSTASRDPTSSAPTFHRCNWQYLPWRGNAAREPRKLSLELRKAERTL